MASTEEELLASCLLQWVQSFEVAKKQQALGGLSDGLSLWAILHDVDGEYFIGQLPEPEVTASSDWTRKWQNLKYLERQVSAYYREVCDEQDQIHLDSTPDLKAIAANSSTKDTAKLIMMIIRAVMASPEHNQEMGQRLMSLGSDNAMLLAKELRDMEESVYTESELIDRDESAYRSEQDMPALPRTNGDHKKTAQYQDPLLEREEELLRAQATIDKLEASRSEAQRLFDGLRMEKEGLEEAFDMYKREIEAKGRKAGGEDEFKKLQRQAGNDHAYIEDLESELRSSRDAVEVLERHLESAKADGEAHQKLKDELQMLRGENEDLNHKIKASENLRKKIQTLQEQEKANSVLKEEIKQANEKLEEVDRLRALQAGLEKEILEKRGLIRNQEYQIGELTTTRKHAEHDARALAHKLQEASERHDRDHEAIQELRGRLHDFEVDDTGAIDRPDSDPSATEIRSMPTNANHNENRHLAEKLALVEQQLEAADIRLKQAAQRNATLEERPTADLSNAEDLEARVQERELTITRLREELETAAAKSNTKTAAPDIAALQRENHFMATAWYDLSSRLQSNGVSLGRRREPKSWLGQQRALIGPGSAQVSTSFA